MAQEPRHEHDLGAVGLGEPLRQRLADLVRGEVLVLDVDVVVRAGDHVEVERLDMAGALAILGRRRGARDRDLGIGDVDVKVRGPRIAATADGLQISPVAARQRSRAMRASAFAASPSTAIITSWNGG